MAISNKKGALLLTTSNKSETAVGYATLYGDMAGGFSVIKDVYKTEVYQLAAYRNRLTPVIPLRIIERPPSAELAPDQKDEDSLPPYAVLDPLLKMLLEHDASLVDIVAQGVDEAIARKVLRMIARSEYKRRQAAPGPKISVRAFHKERRYPITCRF
jgi:NAD+ synthase (glutamine-hydrolysing)